MLLSQDPGSVPLQRTTTGIISNRRPISGTPASTSGSTTPNPNVDAGATSRLSLLATAKREAAKHGLYSRFFRGPVLGPDDDPRVDTTSPSVPSSSESLSVSTPVPDHVGDQDGIIGETKKRKKRKSEDRADTKEERKERKAAKAAKRAEKTLAREKAKEKKDRQGDADRKARKHWDKETQSGENEISSYPKKPRKQARKSVVGDDLEPAKCIRKRLEDELGPTNNGQQDTSHRPAGNVSTDAFDVVPTTKKKKRKRKDTPP